MTVDSPLKKKILVPLLLVLIATLSAIAVEDIVSFRTHLVTRLQQRAGHMADLIELIAGSAAAPAELQDLIGALGREGQVNVIAVVAGEPARVVASTRPAMIGQSPSALTDPELKEELGMAMTRLPGAFRFDQAGNDFDYFHRLTVATEGPGSRAMQRGAVLVSLDTRPLRQQVFGLIGRSIIGYFVAVLLMAISCWFLLDRHVLRPVECIGNAVARFRAGDAARISHGAVSSREFSDLTTTWNGLIDRLGREEVEHKHAEEEKSRLLAEVAAQHRRLRDLLVSVPGLVWEAWGRPDSSQQQMNFMSDYVETMLGYSVKEWLAKPNFWLTIVHPDDQARMANSAGCARMAGPSGPAPL